MAFSLQQHLNFLCKGSSGWKKSWTRRLHFWVLFGPRARGACAQVSIAVQDFFRLDGPFQRKYCSMRFDGKSACCPLILYFPHSRCWRHVNMNGLLWCDLCFPRSVSFCLLCNECFCFALCMSLFYIFLIFCMFLFGFLYFTQFPFWFFWLFIFDIYWCLIDTLFSSVLFITHPYFLVCFFAFSYSLSLSLPHCFFVAFTQDWKVPKINRSVQKNGRTAEYPNNRSRTNEQMQRWKHPFGVEKLKQTLGVKRGLYETVTYGVDINDQKKTKNINKWHWHHQKRRICVKKHWNIWKIKGLFAFFPASRALESSDSPPWVTTSPLPSSGVFNSATCMGFQNGWRKQQTITIKAIAVDPLLQRWQPSAFKFYCWYISVMSKLCRQRNHNKFSRRQRKNIRLHHVKTFSVAQMLLQSCSAMMVSQAP